MDIHFLSGAIVGILIALIVIYFLCKKWNKQKEVLIQNHKHFVHAVESTKDFMYYYQLLPERKYLYLSPSAEYFFGEGSIEVAYADPDVPFRDVHPDDYNLFNRKLKGEVDFNESIVQRWKGKDGRYRAFEEYATPIYENGELVALKGVLRNIDEKIELQKELQYRITHDELTGIYNRALFEQKMVELNDKENVAVAIILCDVDGLKYANDHFGHKMGDALIKATAELLNRYSSDSVTVSRIGGDEFVLIVTDKTENQVEQLVEDIQKEVDNCNISHSNFEMKISLGYSYAPSSKSEMEELFSKADKNMYIDKMNRKKMSKEGIVL